MAIKYFTDIIQPSEITKYLNLLVGDINSGISAVQTTGVWTPFFYGDGTLGSPTYGIQGGSYELTGRLVTARFIVYASALGGMTGNLYIGGLPFPSGGSATDPALCFINQFQGWTGGAGYQYLGGSIGTNSNIVIGENGSGVASKQVPITEVTAPLILVGLCNYHI